MKTKHTHQYMRVKIKESVVYRCMIPGCTHYIPKALLINRIANCPYCGNDFLITRELARRERLHCSSCTVSKKPKPAEVVGFLDSIKNDTGE